MSGSAEKISVLYLGKKHDAADQLINLIAQSRVVDKIDTRMDSENFILELFASHYQVFFCDQNVYDSIENYQADINNLNITIFVLADNPTYQPAKYNIYFISEQDFSRNVIDTLLQMSQRYYEQHQHISNKVIVDNINEFIYIKKPPFESRNISYFSDRVKDILGYEPLDKQLLLKPEQIIHPDDRSTFLVKNIDDEPQALLPQKIRFRYKDTDKYIWIERKAIPQYKEDKVASIIFLCRDITAEVEFARSVENNSLYDNLTKLPSKKCFAEEVDRIYSQKKRLNFVIFCISLDRFKSINDALGHHIGDQVIVEISQRIKDTLKTDDIVARFGGDEFLTCSVNIDYLHEATFLADALIDSIAQPIYSGDSEVYLSCSIGIAMNNPYYKDADTIINDAYQAMYRAKSDILTHYAIYEHDKHNLSGLASMNLESDLRRAIRNDELFLEFQPLVSLRDHSVNTVEALVRWQHPKKGLLMPNEFIPLAEKTGLIVNLGDWVINEAVFAVNHMQNYSDALPIKRVSINISPVQLGQIDLCEKVDQLMVEHQLPSQSIKFEITESVVMSEENAINGILSQFRSMGIQLSMDDFGTGYSSLSYLNHLPFNYVKIDKSFVANLYSKGSGRDFVDTIIQLAHNMNMEVVAEGVETADQALILRNLGCEYAQGYYFCKPVTLANLPAALRKMPSSSGQKQLLS